MPRFLASLCPGDFLFACCRLQGQFLAQETTLASGGSPLGLASLAVLRAIPQVRAIIGAEKVKRYEDECVSSMLKLYEFVSGVVLCIHFLGFGPLSAGQRPAFALIPRVLELESLFISNPDCNLNS